MEAREHQSPGEELFLTRQTLYLEASLRRTTKGLNSIVEELVVPDLGATCVVLGHLPL